MLWSEIPGIEVIDLTSEAAKVYCNKKDPGDSGLWLVLFASVLNRLHLVLYL